MRQVDLAAWVRATCEMHGAVLVASEDRSSARPQFIFHHPRWSDLWLVYVKTSGELTKAQQAMVDRLTPTHPAITIFSADSDMHQLLDDISGGDPTKGATS